MPTPLTLENGTLEAIQWVRDLIRTQADAVKLRRFVVSSVRALTTGRPGLAFYSPSFQFQSYEDSAAFWEAVGLEASGRLIRVPRDEGDEIITESEIASIREKYQTPSIDALGDYFSLKAQEALGTLSFALDGLSAPAPAPYLRILSPVATAARKGGLYGDLIYGE